MAKDSEFCQWRIASLAQPAWETKKKLGEAWQSALADKRMATEIRELLDALKQTVAAEQLKDAKHSFVYHYYELALKMLRTLEKATQTPLPRGQCPGETESLAERFLSD